MAKCIAIIPARKGSKGVPGKNKRLLNGRPLVSYAIEAALKSKKIARVVLTTNDDDVFRISGKYKRIERLKRPAALATDKAPMVPVVLHAIKALDLEGYNSIVLLQPTTPFRTAADIDNCISIMENDSRCDGVISVNQVFDHHPARIKKLSKKGYMQDFCMPEAEAKGRKEFKPAAYVRNGAIYGVKMRYFLKNKTLKNGRMRAYVMPEMRSINIDEELDFIIAEAVARKLKLS